MSSKIQTSSSQAQKTRSVRSGDTKSTTEDLFALKYKRYRELNNLHVKNNRRMKKESDFEIKRVYAENEKRITHLQTIAEILKKELLKDKATKTKPTISIKPQRTESRPKWFGAPF